MLKLSVIVAVYNIGEYIRDCVDSVLGSTYKNIEIILVDDGSTDNCPQICDSYREKCTNVIVIHKENGGLASARKAGADIATGDYVAFLDGDDWVEKDYYEKIMSDLSNTNADVHISALTCYENNEYTCVQNELATGVYDRSYIEKDIIPGILFDNRLRIKVMPGIVLKVVRSEIFVQQMPYVDNAICDNEDTLFSLVCLSKANSVQINNMSTGYIYRILGESMSNVYKEGYWNGIERYCNNLNEISQKLHLPVNDIDLYADGVYMILRYLDKEFFAPNGKKIRERLNIIRSALNKEKYLGQAIRGVSSGQFSVRRTDIFLIKNNMLELLYLKMAFPRILSKMKKSVLSILKNDC